MYEGKKNPTYISGCCERSCFQGGETCRTAKRKTEYGFESPRATVLPGGGAEKDLVQLSKYKNAKWVPGLCRVCRDTGPGSSASSGWAINIRDCSTSPLSQLRGFIPSSWWSFGGWQHQLCPSTTALRCFIIFRCLQTSLVPLNGKSPFCRACGWRCRGWGTAMTRCKHAYVFIYARPMFNFLTIRRAGLLSTFLIEPCLWFFSKHNICAFLFKLMLSPPPNKSLSWIRTN